MAVNDVVELRQSLETARSSLVKRYSFAYLSAGSWFSCSVNYSDVSRFQLPATRRTGHHVINVA